LLLLHAQAGKVFSQDVLPVPDHIVIAILENHAYSQIIGSLAAPHINALAFGQHTALFTQSYGIEHPSQPNYLDLFSGCNQGVTDDAFPATNPFTTSNLGRQLMDSGKTFITYSEDLPEVGFNGSSSGKYVRKHNPAANWMGTGANQIPPATNLPFSSFPSNDFTLLPTVCLVVPNQDNNMHNGSDPERITAGDNWIYNNLNTYVEWAMTHNSIFMLTWDEDNDINGNHIVTILSGQKVKAGEYSETINHYTILRTIEDMYGLSYACNAITATPISGCWNVSNGVNILPPDENFLTIYPNPTNGAFSLKIESSTCDKYGYIELYNVNGEKVFEDRFAVSSLKELHLKNISPGIYFVKVNDGKIIYTKKLIVK
jgi:acid phosphatase